MSVIIIPWFPFFAILTDILSFLTFHNESCLNTNIKPNVECWWLLSTKTSSSNTAFKHLAHAPLHKLQSILLILAECDVIKSHKLNNVKISNWNFHLLVAAAKYRIWLY